MSFFTDDFSDSDSNIKAGTYAPNAGGGTWGAIGSFGTFSTAIDSGKCRVATSGVDRGVVCSASAATEEYDVEVDFKINTIVNALWYLVGSHYDTSAIKCYGMYWKAAAGAHRIALVKLDLSNTSIVTNADGTSITYVSGSFSAGVTYHGRQTVRISGSDKVITGYLTRPSDGYYLKSDGSWQSGEIAFATYTDTSDLSSSGGTSAVMAATDYSTANTGIGFDNIVCSNKVTALAAGTVTFTDATDSQVNLTATEATGGTGPYTKQWKYASTANGSYTNFGTDSLSATDSTISGTTKRWYKCVYTDAAAATVESNLVYGGLWATPMILGFLGDSMYSLDPGAGKPPSYVVADLKRTMLLRRVTLGSNQAVYGTTSDYWKPSNGTHLSDAVTAFSGASCTHVVYMIGTNDYGTTPSTYGTNVSNTAANLVSNGFKVFLCFSPFVHNPAVFNAAAMQNLLDLEAQLLSIADNVNIFVAERLAFEYFAANASQLNPADGVHPLDSGALSIGHLQAVGIAQAVSGSGAAGLLSVPTNTGGMQRS